MMKKLLVMMLVAGWSVSAHAVRDCKTYDDLSQADKNKVQNGELVVKTTPVEGSHWPDVQVYARIDSTPEEAMAVFADYELQKEYLNNILKSEVTKRIDRRTVEVSYTYDVPWPMSNEDYTVRDTLGRLGSDGYRMDWTLVRADTIKDSNGEACYSPLGTGTFLAYRNFVKPGRAGSGWIDGRAVSDVRDAVRDIRNQIHKERRERQDLLQRQIRELRDALR